MRYVFLVLLLSIFSVASYANCPQPSQVTYGCSYGHCNWSAPWYEGFPDSTAQPKDTAARLVRAYWGTTSTKLEPPSLGSTICFYETNRGNSIRLVQNDFGNVPLPTQGHWIKDSWEGHPGVGCYANAASCHFDYGD